LAPAPETIRSAKAEPVAFSIDASVSVKMPSAESWAARLMRTARGAAT
jgi:hypothetical protein